MDLEGIMISEISQTEKNKCHMISNISGIQKKKSNEQNKTKRNSQKQRIDQWLPEGWKMGEMDEGGQLYGDRWQLDLWR